MQKPKLAAERRGGSPHCQEEEEEEALLPPPPPSLSSAIRNFWLSSHLARGRCEGRGGGGQLFSPPSLMLIPVNSIEAGGRCEEKERDNVAKLCIMNLAVRGERDGHVQVRGLARNSFGAGLSAFRPFEVWK